jgi:hypothetical protein
MLSPKEALENPTKVVFSTTTSDNVKSPAFTSTITHVEVGSSSISVVSSTFISITLYC